MLKKYQKFNLLFAAIFMLQLVAVLNNITMLIYITKPLIAISLMVFFAAVTHLKGRFHKRLFAGLIFAFTGDVFLMFLAWDPAFFMYGLIAFLICHILYISAFYLDFKSAPELDKKGARIAIILCASICIPFYLYIRTNLGVMKLPVLAYVIIISLMTMMAAFRNQRVNDSSFKLILTGAVIFMLSDALLAYNKFAETIPNAGFYIMSTYMIAQYLITVGGAERQLLRKD